MDEVGAEAKEEPMAGPPPVAAVQALDANRPVEEDASKLELGPEFRAEHEAQPIFLAEVAHLLQMQVNSKAEQGISAINPTLKQSLEYAEMFNQLSQQDHAITMRKQLTDFQPHLHPFEIAQLATLIPTETEEAKAVIPSLRETFDDNQLNEVIHIIDNML